MTLSKAKKTILEMVGLSFFCLFVYFFLGFKRDLFVIWLFVCLAAFYVSVDAKSYLSNRRKNSPSSKLNGYLYRLIIGSIILWNIVIWILATIHISEGTFHPHVVSIQVALITFAIVGFGWIWMMEKSKNPSVFFSRYLVSMTLISLVAFLLMPTNVLGTNLSLIQLVFEHPFDYSEAYIYIGITSSLFCIYSTKVGKSKWVARSSGLLAIINYGIFFIITATYRPVFNEELWADGYVIILWLFNLAILLPQSGWAIEYGKLSRLWGVGWGTPSSDSSQKEEKR